MTDKGSETDTIPEARKMLRLLGAFNTDIQKILAGYKPPPPSGQGLGLWACDALEWLAAGYLGGTDAPN